MRTFVAVARYFLEIAYRGTQFHGWQSQPNAHTVQDEMEEGLSKLLGQKTSVLGCGRTDTGVHAEQFYLHFETDKSLESSMVYSLNGIVSKEIWCKSLFIAQPDTHARFDASSRAYTYRLTQQPNPFLRESHYYLPQTLDFEKMKEATKMLIGQRDFQCFSKSNTDVKTFICNISNASWDVNEQEALFHITANRFLRNMVRAIVGTLIEIGLGKKEVAGLSKIIESKDRNQAGYSVPAVGLYLSKVEYPSGLFEEVK